MPPVQFVDVYVPNQTEIALHELGMRPGLVDGIVSVEHGPNRWAGDLLNNRDGFSQGIDHVALIQRKGLDQNRHAAIACVLRDLRQSLDKVPDCLRTADAGRPSLLRRTKY